MKKIFQFFIFILLINKISFAQNAHHAIAFASDTQGPMWEERLWLKSNHNEKATEKIFRQIANEQPKAFFLLGDVVSLSYKNRTWKKMDKYLTACREKGFPVYAALGNHEMLGNATEGENNFQTRFPEHIKTGYVEIIDSIAIVLLNSNFKNLSADAIAKQNEWYANELKTLDDNNAVKYVVVGCHHSPFSNSKIVGSSKAVQQNFVPQFIQSKKCKLFLSGHAHVFEYFKMQGKDFMVIGGGGGLHHPLNKKGNRIKAEFESYNPLFHYLTIELINGKLEIISHQLNNDFSAFDEGLKISL